MSKGLVVSDHHFITINLQNDNCVIEADEDAGDGTVTSRITMVDAYSIRLEVRSWKEEAQYQEAMVYGLVNMSLNAFCQHYTTGKRGVQCRNKIVKHRQADKWVARFYPVLPSSPASPDYYKFCKFQLIRYRPWSGDYTQAAGGADATPQQIIDQWTAFVASFAEDGTIPPHHMQSMINEITEQMQNDPEFQQAVTGQDDLLMDEGGGASVGTGDSEELPSGEMEFSNLGVDGIAGLDDEDTVQVPWHADHNWAVTEADLTTVKYPDSVQSLESWRKGLGALPQDFVDTTAEAPVIHRNALNDKQRRFMEIMDLLLDSNNVSSTDSDDGLQLSRCLVLRGRGGTGKSHVMRCLQSELRPEEVKALATTGKAATVLFRGSTVYSTANGLALPLSKNKYSRLNTNRLREMQAKWKDVKVMFVDEMTMLKPQDLHHIDLRLQEVKACDKLFGGIIVVLVGDTAQLPPVGGSSLWATERPRMKEAEKIGLRLYKTCFTTVIELIENNRLLQGDPDVQEFDGFLNRLADGRCTHADWELATQRSHSTIGQVEWARRGFDNPGVIHLYATNKQVEKHNLGELRKCEKPILNILATNSCARARGLASDHFNGLQNSLFVCIGATVVLTTNLWPEMGLSNGSTGVVKDIEFRGVDAAVANRVWNPSMLPHCIWVDFGDHYHGPPFFPNELDGRQERRGWVPIGPQSLSEYVRKANSMEENTLTRTMLPLRLAWAWTIWKVQGQTVDGNVVVNLGPKEAEHGLSYVAFSRVRRFCDIGIIGGVSGDRLTTKISNQEKLKQRLSEDIRLRHLETRTLETLLP